MEENKILSFIAEWYDPHPQITKKFFVRYFVSTHEIEMKDVSNGRKFLKRTKLPPTIKRIDFNVGNNISLFSRDMNFIDYGDSSTRLELQKENEVTVIVASIDPRFLGCFVKYFEEKGFTVTSIKNFLLEDHKQKDNFKALFGIKVHSGERINLSISVKGSNSIQRCYDDKPVLLKTFGEISCASSEQEASDYLAVLDGIETQNIYQDISDSTCCIIKRHVIQSRQVGSVIDYILSTSFKVRSIYLVNLNTLLTEEFYGAYKGVLKNYNDVVNSFNGPAVALQIYDCGNEGVVQRFRELSGPWDANIAKEINPDSIRAKFGICAANNAIHCTDLDSDAPYELAYFFDILANAPK